MVQLKSDPKIFLNKNNYFVLLIKDISSFSYHVCVNIQMTFGFDKFSVNYKNQTIFFCLPIFLIAGVCFKYYET